jgi:hypothetical protein
MAQKPPKYSRAVEVYDRLLSLLLAEPEVERPFLVDGGASINDYSDYLFLFGYRPNAEEWVQVSRDAPQGMAPNDIEAVTIGVLIAATDPEHDMARARAKVAEKFRALERVVTRDMTLGLDGVKATIPTHSHQPLHTTKGAEWNLTADVRIETTLA